MRKMILSFMVCFLPAMSTVFAQTDADRIKSLEEKVEMLTNQLGLDKVDSLADPEEAKKTLNEKYILKK